jgi:hypothetical protein
MTSTRGSPDPIHVGLEQVPQTVMLGQGGRRDHPGGSDQATVIEGHPNGIEAVR